MITTPPTPEQIAAWKRLYVEQGHTLTANRMSGCALHAYFLAQYHPRQRASDAFAQVVAQSAQDAGAHSPLIKAYDLGEALYVGIDLNSGYFHVECAEVERMIPVWDDLFYTRGLSEEELDNFVLAAQYLTLERARKLQRL